MTEISFIPVIICNLAHNGCLINVISHLIVTEVDRFLLHNNDNSSMKTIDTVVVVFGSSWQYDPDLIVSYNQVFKQDRIVMVNQCFGANKIICHFFPIVCVDISCLNCDRFMTQWPLISFQSLWEGAKVCGHFFKKVRRKLFLWPRCKSFIIIWQQHNPYINNNYSLFYWLVVTNLVKILWTFQGKEIAETLDKTQQNTLTRLFAYLAVMTLYFTFYQGF